MLDLLNELEIGGHPGPWVEPEFDGGFPGSVRGRAADGVAEPFIYSHKTTIQRNLSVSRPVSGRPAACLTVGSSTGSRNLRAAVCGGVAEGTGLDALARRIISDAITRGGAIDLFRADGCLRLTGLIGLGEHVTLGRPGA